MRVPLYSHGYQLKIPKALSHFKGTTLHFKLFHILRLLFIIYSMKSNLSVRNIYNSIHHNKQIIVGLKSSVLFINSALRPVLMFDCCHMIALHPWFWLAEDGKPESDMIGDNNGEAMEYLMKPAVAASCKKMIKATFVYPQ